MSQQNRKAHAPPMVQVVSSVLWPAFILAGAATGVFFTFLDPVEVLDCQGKAPLGHTAAYTIGFFGFWLLAAASSLATLYFYRTPVPPRAFEHD